IPAKPVRDKPRRTTVLPPSGTWWSSPGVKSVHPERPYLPPSAGIVMVPVKPPTYQTSAPYLGPSYFANRYSKPPVPRFTVVPVPLELNTAGSNGLNIFVERVTVLL